MLLIVLFPFLFGLACSSGEVMIQPQLTGKEKVVTRVRGEACGHIGLLATAYYFIPFNLNTRVERAYTNAMMQAPGAVGLTNITIDESWYWALFTTVRCTVISGDAVK
ncbi:hypothetical protein EHQ52_12365 [Leptospira koniambonensis]|uniref:TRL-like family protein n=1 Tax=Leptospira koniambonensis TaxID=2484950 RepID=A0A4R9JA40_9LEPT|nr:hypothetical protein EHQ52_12365 [Leptospira koniambonensis]